MAETTPLLLITTTETIAGYRIVRTLGYVEGSNWEMRGHNSWSPPGGTLAKQRICEAARQMGANAVVAARWEAGAGGMGAQHGFIYGTAVMAVPEAG